MSLALEAGACHPAEAVEHFRLRVGANGIAVSNTTKIIFMEGAIVHIWNHTANVEVISQLQQLIKSICL